MKKPAGDAVIIHPSFRLNRNLSDRWQLPQVYLARAALKLSSVIRYLGTIFASKKASLLNLSHPMSLTLRICSFRKAKASMLRDEEKGHWINRLNLEMITNINGLL